MSRKRIFLLAGVAAGVFSSPALAQTAPQAPAAEQPAGNALDRQSGEIIVTAQKREENVMKVPVSVQVMSQDKLTSANVISVADLPRITPALTATQAVDSLNSSLFLRGVGTYSFSIGIEPSVAVVVDDVPVMQQAQALGNLADLERLEVLRGPQGTLFGRAAAAGVINVVTAGPSKHLKVVADGTVTNDGEFRIQASASGPISNNVGFRLNAFYFDTPGYIHNLTNGADMNRALGKGIRGKLVWDATDRLKITLTGDYSKLSGNGNVSTFRLISPNSKLYGNVAASTFAAGIDAGPNNYSARNDTEQRNDSETITGIVRASYDLSFASINYIGSYSKWNAYSLQDNDYTDINAAAALTGSTASGNVTQGGPLNARQVTQELRLVSNKNDQLEYVAGLFFADADSFRFFTRGPITLSNYSVSAGNRALAVYGNATLHLNDTTQVVGGLRYNNNRVSVNFTNNFVPVSYPGAHTESAVTGKIALQKFFGDVMAFASFSTGYKGPGYDIVTGFNQSKIDNMVQKETSKSYEIGLKGKLLNKVRFELTGFWEDFQGFQAQSLVTDPTTLVSQLRVNNVGSMRTRGVELQTSVRVSPAFRIEANGAYTDAKVVNFPTAACYALQSTADGCVATGSGTSQNLAGHRLSNAPEFKFDVTGQYQQTVPGTSWDAFGSLSYQYQSSVNYDLYGNPRTVQGAYGLVNLNAGVVKTNSENIRVTFFVNNLFNKHYTSYLLDVSNTFGGQPTVLQQFARNSFRYGGVSVRTVF